MDLSFALHDLRRPVRALPAELAVLLVGIAARQAASPTARLQAMLDGALNGVNGGAVPAPAAFNRATAATLAADAAAVKAMFT